MTPDTVQDTIAADLSSARPGRFQEKETNTDYLIEYSPSEKKLFYRK